MQVNDQYLRTIHAQACTAVARANRNLTPEVDAFSPLYLNAVLTSENATYQHVDDLRQALGEAITTKLDELMDKDVFDMHDPRNIDPIPDELLPLIRPFPTTAAACDVLAERHRQLAVEGWTAKHDDEHGPGALALAAAAYALDAGEVLDLFSPADAGDRYEPLFWPFSSHWWKPGEPRRGLVKAASLVLAEIERIDRVGV